MKYIGLQSQIWRNNTNSLLLLIMFPIVLYALTWVFLYFVWGGEYDVPVETANEGFVYMFPWITVGVLIWFLIAYASHSSMIRKATGAKTGDIVFFSADEYVTACESLGQVRLECGRKLDLIDNSVFAYLWVNEFPMF